MTTNSNCPFMSVLKKRFNEINLKSFSENNLDKNKKEWLTKHEEQRGRNKEVAQPERELEELTQGQRQHVAVLMEYQKRAAETYPTSSKPSGITHVI